MYDVSFVPRNPSTCWDDFNPVTSSSDIVFVVNFVDDSLLDGLWNDSMKNLSGAEHFDRFRLNASLGNNAYDRLDYCPDAAQQ